MQKKPSRKYQTLKQKMENTFSFNLKKNLEENMFESKFFFVERKKW